MLNCKLQAVFQVALQGNVSNTPSSQIHTHTNMPIELSMVIQLFRSHATIKAHGCSPVFLCRFLCATGEVRDHQEGPGQGVAHPTGHRYVIWASSTIHYMHNLPSH